MAQPDEDTLFEQFRRDGDPAVLGAVFDLVAPALLRVARHLVCDAHDAEDLLHSTFVTAIEARARWDRDRGLFAWLVGILSMRARELSRRRMRIPDPRRLAPHPVDDPAESAASREAEAQILAAVDGLPEACRAVVRLHLRHGLKPGEIASALDRPAGTVRTQLARGLRALRTTLPTGATALALQPTDIAALGSVRGLLLTGLPVHAGAAGVVAVAGITVMNKSSVAIVVAVLLAVGLSIASLSRERSGDLGPSAPPVQPRVATTDPADRRASENDSASERRPIELEATAPATPVVAVAHAVGTLRVRTRFDQAHGGAVAPGMVIRIWPGASAVSSYGAKLLKGTTDLFGEVLFEGLDPGPFRVLMPVWQPGNPSPETFGVEVVAGQEAVFDGLIDVGRAVAGVVVDEGDHPITGARILFQSVNGGEGTREVARTDGEGRFRANAVAFESRVGVLARGFAASATVPIPRGDTDVRIVLSERAGSVRCRVTGRDGSPLAGAEVSARSLAASDPMGDNSTVLPFISSPATTDELGVAFLEGLPAEMVKVRVHRGGAIDAWTEVRIPDHGTAELDVVLSMPGSVAGTAFRVDGSPFVGAHVEIGHHLPIGALASVEVAADGTFRFRGVPPGEFEMIAWKEHDELEAHAFVRVTESERTQVELVARMQPGVAGRVLDMDGEPVWGYVVTAIEQTARARARSARTDADGHFSIESLSPHRIRVVAIPPGGDEGVPSAVRVDVEPGASGVELRVRRGSGSVVVSLLGSGGSPYADQLVRLRLEGENEGRWLRTADDGRVRFDAVPPGRLHLEVLDGGLPRDVVEPVDLDPDTELDLGFRMILAPGRVELELTEVGGRPFAGTAPRFVVVALDPRSQWRVPMQPGPDGRPFAVLGEGPCRVLLDNEVHRDLAADDVVVDVGRGETQVVTVAIRSGVGGVLRFARPPDANASDTDLLRAEIRDATGRILCVRSLLAPPGAEFVLRATLVPGDYEVSAQGTGGMIHRGRFSVVPATAFDVAVPRGS